MAKREPTGEQKQIIETTDKSPSTATDFLLGGSNNGWNYWKVAT